MDDSGASAAQPGGRPRRRRRRARRAEGPPVGTASLPVAAPETTRSASPGSAGPASAAPSGRRRREARLGAGDGREAERGLRDLVGAGPSQLGVSRALRGRDVNRPTEQDLAAAEREVVLVRRYWTPS